jgi:DNA adenine methylase
MSASLDSLSSYPAKPFLKWAGGKSQLLAQFRRHFPAELSSGAIHRYVEPFLGGGAVFLDVAQRCPIQESHLFDINEELILSYTVVQRDPLALIEQLTNHRQHSASLDEAERSNYFYCVRDRYNTHKRSVDFRNYSAAWIERAADMIFLNKTCFNGLFRVNASGMFNVPFGRYRNPVLFEEQNILAVSQLLQHATLQIGSFSDCDSLVDATTFVYFDPPYRPISQTSSFTSYSNPKFGDDEQRRLAHFFADLAARTGAKLMLSNSDPKNLNPADDFFDALYASFTIHRVSASRMINSAVDGRGRISEIVVTNY